MDRRLAAILAADVVGYSGLMEADETGTLARLRSHRNELIEPTIAEHHGRIVKLMGDGLLAEFASVVDAVGSAVAIQEGIAERNKDASDETQIALRIGVHLGDVIVEDDDIYGDGVNVAARLEGLADAGGICLSRQAFDQIEHKLDLKCESLGPKHVKNIKRQVDVYRVLLDGSLPRPPPSSGTRTLTSTRNLGFAGALIVLVLAAGAVWWRPWQPEIEAASIARMAHPLPDKPSIAVLPFVNMSNDPEQEYFVDGLTEDIITDLSKVSDLFVIARNSSFTYKGQLPPPRQVSEDLGVRYVLEGSARRVGEQVRINAQLIDATTGGHVWADRVDRAVDEVFSVQNELVLNIADALGLALGEDTVEELTQGQTSNIEAREAFQRGWESYHQYTRDNNDLAIEQLQRAVELDPAYGRAYAALALAYFTAGQFRWLDPNNVRSVAFLSLGLSTLSKARQYPTALASVAAATADLMNWREADALNEATSAITQDPNDPAANLVMAQALLATGSAHAAPKFVDQAVRLDPAFASHYAMTSGISHFALGEWQQAADVFSKALDDERGSPNIAPFLAASYAKLGLREKAHAALRRWLPGAGEAELQEKVKIPIFPFVWPGNSDLLSSLHDGVLMASLPLDVTVGTLIHQLQQADAGGRANAAQALGWFGPQSADAVPALVDALADESTVIRKEAALSLGKIGPDAKSAIPALRAVDKPPLLASHAQKAIKKIEGK